MNILQYFLPSKIPFLFLLILKKIRNISWAPKSIVNPRQSAYLMDKMSPSLSLVPCYLIQLALIYCATISLCFIFIYFFFLMVTQTLNFYLGANQTLFCLQGYF